jgi:type I restriction enzyme, R subunit
MNKKELSERDICTKFITPALRRAGWDEQGQLRGRGEGQPLQCW